MTQRRGELAVCAVLAVLGLAMAVRSFGYHVFGAGGRIGPGFTPLVAGAALAAFAGWAFAEAFARQRRERAPSQPHDDAQDETAPVATGDRDVADGSQRRVMLVFAMTLGALALSIVTGFLVAFGLLVLTLLWFVEREKPWLAVTISVVATTGSWLVFVVLLQVPLPGGMLGLLGGA